MAFTCSLLVEDRIAKITLSGELDAASASVQVKGARYPEAMQRMIDR